MSWGNAMKVGHTFDGQSTRDVIWTRAQGDGRGCDIWVVRELFVQERGACRAPEGPELEVDVRAFRVHRVDDLHEK